MEKLGAAPGFNGPTWMVSTEIALSFQLPCNASIWFVLLLGPQISLKGSRLVWRLLGSKISTVWQGLQKEFGLWSNDYGGWPLTPTIPKDLLSVTDGVCNGNYDTLYSHSTSFLRGEHLDVTNGPMPILALLPHWHGRTDTPSLAYFPPELDMVFLGTQFFTPSRVLQV